MQSNMCSAKHGFTHNRISSGFRNGDLFGELLDCIVAGALSPDVFPPMRLVEFERAPFIVESRAFRSSTGGKLCEQLVNGPGLVPLVLRVLLVC